MPETEKTALPSLITENNPSARFQFPSREIMEEFKAVFERQPAIPGAPAIPVAGERRYVIDSQDLTVLQLNLGMPYNKIPAWNAARSFVGILVYGTSHGRSVVFEPANGSNLPLGEGAQRVVVAPVLSSFPDELEREDIWVHFRDEEVAKRFRSAFNHEVGGRTVTLDDELPFRSGHQFSELDNKSLAWKVASGIPGVKVRRAYPPGGQVYEPGADASTVGRPPVAPVAQIQTQTQHQTRQDIRIDPRTAQVKISFASLEARREFRTKWQQVTGFGLPDLPEIRVTARRATKGITIADQVQGVTIIQLDSHGQIVSTITPRPDPDLVAEREAWFAPVRDRIFNPDGSFKRPRDTNIWRLYFDNASVNREIKRRFEEEGLYIYLYDQDRYTDTTESAKGNFAETLAKSIPGLTVLRGREQLELESQYPRAPEPEVNQDVETQRSEYKYACTLLNPKSLELITIWADSDVSSFQISIAGEAKSFGSSYIVHEEGPDGERRVHTPSGVKKTGGGYGLMLYTGTACAVAISRSRPLPGVMSEPGTRSSSADAIWDRMVEAGLSTLERGGESEEEGEEDNFCVPIPTRLKDQDDYYVTSDEVCGTVAVTRRGNEKELNILTACSVVNHKLVVDADFKDSCAKREFEAGERPPIASLARAKISSTVTDPKVIWTYALMIQSAVKAQGDDVENDKQAQAALVAFITDPEHIKHLGNSPAAIEFLGQQTLFGPSDLPRHRKFDGFRGFRAVSEIDPVIIADLHEAALAMLVDEGEAEAWTSSFGASLDIEPGEE